MPKKILVADDNAMIRKSRCRIFFREEFFQVAPPEKAYWRTAEFLPLMRITGFLTTLPSDGKPT
jgi:hypothetical protein